MNSTQTPQTALPKRLPSTSLVHQSTQKKKKNALLSSTYEEVNRDKTATVQTRNTKIPSLKKMWLGQRAWRAGPATDLKRISESPENGRFKFWTSPWNFSSRVTEGKDPHIFVFLSLSNAHLQATDGSRTWGHQDAKSGRRSHSHPSPQPSVHRCPGQDQAGGWQGGGSGEVIWW